MAKTVTFSQATTANQVINAQTDVADSRFNPVERTSRVKLYAKSDAANGRATFSLGAEDHATDVVLPVDTGSLSTRDHLVAEGIALRGQKITVGIRNAGAGTPTVTGMVVIEAL